MPWILVFLLAFVSLWGQPPKSIPVCPDTVNIVRHTGYTLHYVEHYEQPDWVAYDLTAADTRGKENRTDNFRPDPAVKTGSATLEDYRGSGYDRGHLAPAGDMKWSAVAMDESFYLSNMSPQAPEFNRGIWNRLEGQVRTWAQKYGELWIVTGPVLQDGFYDTIGPDKVAVPRRFYKVLYDPKRHEAVGFILENRKGVGSLTSYEMTVDDVERITGLNFFPELPDSLEVQVESKIDVKAWPMSTGRK